ncbi:MAG: endonuclease/exonuclease/phosphatase family protein [Lachnospiraceae bacterium]|nr:endonuclease/exonuclease/phosphatase family protein [Lachnospiraceae bacterium]
MKKSAKIILIVAIALIAALLLTVVGYFLYVFIASGNRVGDQTLTPEGTASKSAIETGKDLKIVSYNIGFAAYTDDFGFFMDGGKYGRAYSKDSVKSNMENIAKVTADQKADLYILQEVDTDSTRSYHVDEREYFKSALAGTSYSFAQNWNSPYLCYPFIKPHGAAKSGLMTVSNYTITEAARVELPVETGVMRIVDLDRCYSKSIIPADNGKQLVLYNFHLSAYTSDGTIAVDQLKMLLEDMQAEYNKGNYCIAGGDCNKDLLGPDVFGKGDKEYSWAQPIPEGTFDPYNVKIVAPYDSAKPVPSCRNADGPYHEGQYVLTVDGFLVTDNVNVKSSVVVDTGFAYSDHNPVTMTFELVA